MPTRPLHPSRCLLEPLEPRRHFAVTYAVGLPTGGPITTWANGWSNVFKLPNGPYTGSDGIVSIPLNGIDKLGSGYDTPGWQQWTTGDAFIGQYNSVSGVRNSGTKFVNNIVGIQNSSGATPNFTSFRYRGSIATTPQEQMAIVPRNSRGDYQWPSDGLVVNGKVVQLSIRMNGTDQVGVSLIEAPVPSSLNINTFPYANPANITVRDMESANGVKISNNNANLYTPHTRTGSSDPYVGPRSATGAVLDLRNNTVAYDGTGYIYTYAVQQGAGFFEKFAFVGRAKAGVFATSSAWEWYLPAQNKWVTSTPTASALSMATPLRTTSGGTVNDAASEFSVFQMPDGRLAMVYAQNDISSNIAVRYAPAGHPEGPWSAPTVIYNIAVPDAGNSAIGLRPLPAGFPGASWSYVTYGAKVHPQLSKAPTGTGTANSGRLLLSYHLQTWGPAGQLSPEFSYGDIYRIRFLELSLVGTNTTSRPPPASPAPLTNPRPTPLTGPRATSSFSETPLEDRDLLSLFA